MIEIAVENWTATKKPFSSNQLLTRYQVSIVTKFEDKVKAMLDQVKEVVEAQAMIMSATTATGNKGKGEVRCYLVVDLCRAGLSGNLS